MSQSYREKRDRLSQERVKELLDYNPETGVFIWRERPPQRGVKRLAGQIAGNKAPNHYRTICVDNVTCLVHRLVWFYVHGYWPASDIDHINGDQDDNRIANLREATRGQNHANRRRSSKNKSGFKGVHLHPQSGLWVAQVMKAGRKHSSYHKTPEEAAAAYRTQSIRLFGEFARYDI